MVGGGLIWTIISTSEITFVMFYFEENPENSSMSNLLISHAYKLETNIISPVL